MSKIYDVIVLGAGPAGLTAGLYAGRSRLSTLIIEKGQDGGQIAITNEIENYPGQQLEGESGPSLIARMTEQAKKFGCERVSDTIKSVDFSGKTKKLVGTKGEYEARTVIIATGAAARYLGLDDEQKYMGMGVSACAVCDGFFYRNKTVAVVGGGDSACEEATYLANICKKVYLVVRKDYLRASKVMQRRVLDNPKITVLFNSNVIGLFGDPVLQGAHLIEYVGTEREQKYDIAIDGLFLAIGHTPNSKPFSEYVDTDAQGFITLHDHTQATSVAGVFAAGDVCDPTYRQAIVAASTGCKAALDAERFLIENEG